MEESGGIGFAATLTLIFVTLKLTEVITWSWWWILSPFWIPLGIMILLFGAVGIATLREHFIKK